MASRPMVNMIEEDGWTWFWMPMQFFRPSSDEWIEVVWDVTCDEYDEIATHRCGYATPTCVKHKSSCCVPIDPLPL